MLVTTTVPLVVPAATTAVIVVAFTLDTLVQAVPLMLTEVLVAEKFSPIIVIVPPIHTGSEILITFM